mgnify:CR=1 FL=1
MSSTELRGKHGRWFGWNIGMSHDGRFIGGKHFTGNSDSSVSVYKLSGTVWTQFGNAIALKDGNITRTAYNINGMKSHTSSVKITSI